VPFVRVSRDRRGYEHTYLFEVSNRRPSRPRILYWFRTPPGVKVGREPFDEPVKRALEAQNPGVMFDWKKLASDTLPPPDVENWRERRRAEREAKRASTGDEERTAAGDDEPEAADEPAGQASGASAGEMPRDDLPSEAVGAIGGSPAPFQKPQAASGAGEAGPAGHRHRRRHRGSRHRRSTPRPGVPVVPQGDSPPTGTSISKSSTSESISSISDTAISDRASVPAAANTAEAGPDASEEK
jgi:hypothetical protein